MSFEDKILSQIDRNFPKNILEDKNKRARLLELKRSRVDEFRPNLDEFVDIIEGGEEEIKKDKIEVTRLKKIFQENSSQNERMQAIQEVSEIYEGVLVDQIEANAWFGENCEMIITSEYDDIKNGIDGVGIFKQEGKESDYLGFGIDVTFAADIEVLSKKLDSIKSVVRNNKLPQVKYFVDEEGNHVSLNIPKVIVGSRLSSAEKLIELWGSKKSDRNEQLKNHEVQSKLIMETLWQLRYFYDYAMTVKNDEAAYAYAKSYNAFCSVFEEKKDLILSHWNEIQDDIVFETIKKFTGN